MLSQEEVKLLIADLESDRVERTISVREDKLGHAICAFSNDYANSKLPGYIFIGVNDNGTVNGMAIGDDILQSIGNVRSNGNVLPQPSMVVSPVYNINGGNVVAVEVQPSFYPPVRYNGRCYIRVGPRKAQANEAEERRLIEKRSTTAKTFDSRPCPGTTIADLSTESIKLSYLPSAISADILHANHRQFEEQIASLRLYDLPYNCPTNAGILLFGTNPLLYIYGAYIQYVKFNGTDFTPDIEYEKQFSGALITELKSLDDFIKSNIIKSKPVQNGTMQEDQVFNYPFWAVRELVMNAVMHRDYESNAPIYIYEFADRIEIINSGGLFGEARPENFPNSSDYRNPVIAEAMKSMGYVNRFNFGIRNAQIILKKSGNPEAVFNLGLITKFQVVIRINNKW
jgi:ATP-dependent DNA helicase RecG